MKQEISDLIVHQHAAVERYYRWHAQIYDLTRWSFLFGRRELLHLVTRHRVAPLRILEVGCGTGHNLRQLGLLFPAAEITGLDLSPAMLRIARQKLALFTGQVQLYQRTYAQPLPTRHTFDVILFSYALSMMHADWPATLHRAYTDLAEGGIIAVVDFHDSPVGWWTTWMRRNHVCMDGQLLPSLTARFHPRVTQVHRAYGGLWRYFLFLGEKLLP